MLLEILHVVVILFAIYGFIVFLLLLWNREKINKAKEEKKRTDHVKIKNFC